MRFQQVLPHIHWVSFNEQAGPAGMFLRPEAFYESPKFQGKTFTVDEFFKWYDTTDMPKPYESFWDSFNIPDWVLKPFREGSFDPLNIDEMKLLEMTANLQEPFYIIGTMQDDGNQLNHEISHGLFYIDASYRDRVLKILDDAGGLSGFPNLVEHLRANDYAESVLMDEIHAYLMFERDYLAEEGVETLGYESVSRALFQNFQTTVRRHRHTGQINQEFARIALDQNV